MMRVFALIFLIVPVLVHSLTLQEEVKRDLEFIGFPPAPLRPVQGEILDVAIIGGGHMGMSICFALQRQGIFNTVIFDSAPQGLEGPWLTSARMRTLRSSKGLTGPALDIPHLTFRAWYEVERGNWDSLGRIPTPVWAEYLQWFRKILNLPIRNSWQLLSIIPNGELFKLLFNDGREVLTRKVVLATGRAGFGGFEVPAFIQGLPKSFWCHTGEVIEPAVFEGKRVCIIGCGASAFDVAATALEANAERVDMIMRRTEIPKTNPYTAFVYWPAFSCMCDEDRAGFFLKAAESGIPPPPDSVARLKKWNNFSLEPCTYVEGISTEGNRLFVQTNKGVGETDLIVLATGYAADAFAVRELAHFADKILLWGDRLQGIPRKLAGFPYLGDRLEFLEKNSGEASYLKNIHCFNYGAFLSQGRITGDIDVMGVGVVRLAEKITIDLFLKDYSAKAHKSDET